MSDTVTAKDKSNRHETEQNLTVALRVRPLNEDEIIQGATPVAHSIENTMVVLMDPLDDPDDVLRVNRSREKTYVYDIAFDGSATQKEVYDQTTKSLIPSVIDGYNATVFAYGATGAGKTYTMLGTDDEPGIMAQALNDLFKEMAHTVEEMSYKVTMSYLEIYNEMIRDLLNPSSGYLDLREDAKGVQVAGLTEISTQSTREVMTILFQGNKERTSEPTAANKTSSRSHAVLQITVHQRKRHHGIKQEVRQGRLFLIDLAGSERAANTRNKGKRMVEGAHINRSLLALGNCINALSDKNGSRYVNYRDSKLTRLLKDALGGNCRTVMIAHISPASIHFEESRNTLLYADRAKQIKTKVRRNVLDVSYHISQYANIISELREEVKRLKVKLDTSTKHSVAALAGSVGSTEVDKLKERLISVFREQMEIRRSLMDLNNTAMEISLDVTRNKLVLKKWEREKGLTSRKRAFKELKDTADSDTTGPDSDAVFITESKELELRGDSPVAPEEVKAAREDLDALMREKERTDKIRSKITGELDAARDRAGKIEEMLPRITSSAHQQEVLSLLCRVHELEIDNMEMQSACLLRNFEIRKIDMAVLKYEQHRQLCDDIILQQRSLLEDREAEFPAAAGGGAAGGTAELEELYELYDQERDDMFGERKISLPGVTGVLQKTGSISNLSRKLMDIDSMSDFTSFDPVGADTESVVALPRIFTPGAVGGAGSHMAGISTGGGGANNSTAAAGGKRPLFRPTANSMSQVKEENTSALFSHSPRAREILREQQAEDVSLASPRSTLHPHSHQPSTTLSGLPPRKESIITLSSSDSTPPPLNTKHTETSPRDTAAANALVLSSRDSLDFNTSINPQQRQIIATSTRNIAALALQRRSKASLNELNTLQRDRLQHIAVSRPLGYLDHATAAGTAKASSDNKLTESRLAMHNKKYPAQRRQAFEDVAASDNNVAKPRGRSRAVAAGGREKVNGRAKAATRRQGRSGGELGYPSRLRGEQRNEVWHAAMSKHQQQVPNRQKEADQSQTVVSYQQMDPETFFKQLAKSSPRRTGTQPIVDSLSSQRRSHLPTTTNKENLPKPNQLSLHPEEDDDDLVELKSSQEKGVSRVVQQRAPEKGKGQTLTRKVKGPRVKKSSKFPDDSSTLKPDHKKKNPSTNKTSYKQPTIPSYGTADIGVSGFSLQ